MRACAKQARGSLRGCIINASRFSCRLRFSDRTVCSRTVAPRPINRTLVIPPIFRAMSAVVYRRTRHLGHGSINNSMSRGRSRTRVCPDVKGREKATLAWASGCTKAPNLAEIPSPASLSRDCAPRRSFNGGHYAAAVHQLTALVLLVLAPTGARAYILPARIIRRKRRAKNARGRRRERSLSVCVERFSRGQNDTRLARYRYIDVAWCTIRGTVHHR